GYAWIVASCREGPGSRPTQPDANHRRQAYRNPPRHRVTIRDGCARGCPSEPSCKAVSPPPGTGPFEALFPGLFVERGASACEDVSGRAGGLRPIRQGKVPDKPLGEAYPGLGDGPRWIMGNICRAMRAPDGLHDRLPG